MEGRWLVRVDPGATVGDQRSGDGLTGEFFEVGSGRVSKEAVDGGCVREGEDEHGVGLAGAALDAGYKKGLQQLKKMKEWNQISQKT